VCDYLLKQDKDPFFWGRTKEEKGQRNHRKNTGKTCLDFMKKLRKCATWVQVLADDTLFLRASKGYSSLKQVF